MTLGQRINTLPARLRTALLIWMGLALVCWLLPASTISSVGVLAHPVFWCVGLPLLALAPYRRQLLPAATPARSRRQRTSSQATRRQRPAHLRRSGLAAAA